MGFFDRFTAKKPAPSPVPASDTHPAVSVQPEASNAAAPATAVPVPAGGVKPRLVAGRERLEANDLPGALAIYEEILASAGDRADVLVTISGDLGTHGHVAEIVELIAPRYDAARHGPATGINLVQAYLAVRNPDAAQHVLDILFGLNRPELEDRLHGFSNAIAELMTVPEQSPAARADNPAPADAPKVGLITISKPVWFYGLESLASQVLPPKEGRLRRIAFAQLSLPGTKDVAATIEQPEDELGRLARAIPLWLSETFYFSVNYAPVAAIGVVTLPNGTSRPMTFAGEWTVENLRQLVETTSGGLDYIFTGALRATAGDYELVLRLYEVKSYRERKKITVRWTPATMDAELTQLHAELRRFMEWSPASASLAYVPPASPRVWLNTLGASGGLFAAEKNVIAKETLPPAEPDLSHAAKHAADSEAASLAFLTMRSRATKLALASGPADAPLARSALVQQAAAAM